MTTPAFRFDIPKLQSELLARTGILPSRATGLGEFLFFLCNDEAWTSIREMAYVGATCQWETGGKF